MLYFTMRLISRIDPIKYIFEKSPLTGKISHWQMLLSKFDIVFVVWMAIKGQAIVDYLANQPLNDLDFLEMRQPLNPKVSKHYLCLFSLSTQLVDRCFSHLG